MIIRDLSELSIKALVECLLSAFSNYYVTLPTDVSYWEARFIAARVDRSLSFGMFYGEKLVGFIITGVDKHEEKLTAFNSGTGVLPDYRGKGIVDDLYAHALPVFKAHGIEKCLLEVIQENVRALKVYRRIGFKIKRRLISWKGTLPEPLSDWRLQKIDFQHILNSGLYRSHFYSWDNMAEAVLLSKESKNTYLLLSESGMVKGYFVVGPGGQVVQLDTEDREDLSEVVKNLAQISKEVTFGNIPQEREDLSKVLTTLNFKNPVQQYEMEFFL